MDDHLDGLLKTLQAGDGMARKRARETITLLGDPAVSQLQALLSDPEKRVRWEATKALGAIVDPGSAGVLVGLLDDPHSEIRWLASTGLINLGPRSLVPLLEPLTRPPLSRGRAEMSHRVLRELSKENDTLAGVIAPVLEALDRRDTALVSPAAARALSDLDSITGRLP